MTEIERNQLSKISSFLDSISSRMVADISDILNENFGLYKEYSKTDIEFFDFEINEDGYSISFYPMDLDNTQLGYKKTLPEYQNGFLRDMDLDLDTDNYDFDDDVDIDRMDEFYLQLQTKVIDWFNKCWIKAGGLNTKNNFIIAVHDSDKSFDLKRQKWVNNNN